MEIQPLHRVSARGPSPLLLVPLALLALSCTPTHVSRDLRAVWADDDSSVLVVRSEYDTWKPANPYHYDPDSFGFEVVLLEASPPSAGATALTALHEVDRFEEAAWDPGLGEAVPLASGGLAQYSPVYWFPALRRAVFSGGNVIPYARNVDAGRTTWFVKPTALVRAAYAEAYPLEGGSRLNFLAAESSPFESLPSPDGLLLVARYGLFEIPGNDPFADFDYYSVLVLYDSLTGQALDALVPLADPRYDLRLLDGYAPLATEAQNYSSLAWAPAGDALYAYYLQLSGNDSRLVRLVALAGDRRSFVSASDAATLPARPLPTSSGPVSTEGRAFRMSISGNTTSISLSDFLPGSATPAWKPQGLGDLVPLADFLPGSFVFNY